MNIAVVGAKGRVGSIVVALAKQRNHTVWEIDKENAKNSAAKSDVDVVIDFSLPSATQQVCDLCKKHNAPLVSGVTGHTASQLQMLNDLEHTLPVIHRSNYAQGVAALVEICQATSHLLPNWDCAIVEIHRKNKLDSPSGTAKTLATALSKNKSFASVEVCSVRSGDQMGTHKVIFGGMGEQIEITHTCTSLDVFARGALDCAEKLVKNKKICLQ